ncbi:MAG: glycosyltransferase family 4 protein [Persicimonas sp.]
MLDARYLSGESSGIGRYTEHLVDNLLELDDRLRLKLITHPKRPRPFESSRVSCQTFRAAPNSLRTRHLLSRVVDTARVDLFHSPFNILPGGLQVPCIFTLHDIMWLIDAEYCTDSWWRKLITGTFYKALIPRSVAQAERVLTVSHHSRKSIEEYFPSMQERVDVTYNGVDPFFRPIDADEGWPLLEKWLEPDTPFVLVVGQGSPYKNHAGALAGFIEAFEDVPEMHFVLVRRLTRGPATELRRLMRRPSVADRIIQLDYVSGEELRALYSLARVFLFPSLYEGFGLPALEAMSCGTPVVTSDRGAPMEVAGPASLTVDPESPEAIGEALEKLYADDELYERLRKKGLEHAGQFTWRRCAEETLRVYREVLGVA